jgi:hypothetical protein
LTQERDAARYLAVSDWTVRQMIWRGDYSRMRKVIVLLFEFIREFM